MASTLQIQAVAQLIAENVLPQVRFDVDTRALAEQINDGDGWTIEQSAPLGNVLRTEGLHLSADELDVAYALAEQD